MNTRGHIAGPAYFTIAQIAERWQVSTKTVRRMIIHNALKIHRIGNQIRVSADDLLTYEKTLRS
jgi:excisionase family DNA binding protein